MNNNVRKYPPKCNMREFVYDKSLQVMYIRTTDNSKDMCIKGLLQVRLSKLHAIA
jgi:hypothetical protein